MSRDLASAAWLEEEARRLLEFPRGPVPPHGGAYWLGDHGDPIEHEAIHTWITARTLYVYALADLAGMTPPRWRVDAAARGLAGPLRDPANGGWRESSVSSWDKTAYAHAAVLLATAAAKRARFPVDDLFHEALDAIDRHLWDERSGMSRDTMSADWSSSSRYRGLNANMHLVEAFLAVDPADAPGLVDRAIGICRRAAGWAADNEWRLPEHFDDRWTPDLAHGADRPDDPFRPYGSTPGHGFEWARLMVGASRASGAADRGWLMEAATALYDRAATDGWARNGHPGFAYTVDWSGRPVVETRLFWVPAEAVAAAAVLHRATGEARYERDCALWWRYIAAYLVDRTKGSWRHELDAENRPAHTIWRGKPDLYHAFQACLIPRLPLAASVVASVAAEGADV